MQLVVVMAVRKAVRAATTTFTAISINRLLFIRFLLLTSYLLLLTSKRVAPKGALLILVHTTTGVVAATSLGVFHHIDGVARSRYAVVGLLHLDGVGADFSG